MDDRNGIRDYLAGLTGIPVSPIWAGRKQFCFLCCGFLDIAQAMGFTLRKVSDDLTVVEEGQLPDARALDALIEADAFDDSCFEAEVATLTGLKEVCRNDESMRVSAEFPPPLCGGGSFGPLTVASGILGAENLIRLAATDRDFVCRLVSHITGRLEDLARREADAGAEFLWIAEPLASLFSPKMFWKLSGRYLERIFQAARVPGFLHVCGKTAKHTRELARTGAQVLSIDACTDIGECIRMVGPDVAVMGNISPMTLRYEGRDAVERETDAVLEAVRGFSNFILSTGCSTIDGTPDENVEVLFDAAKRESLRRRG